MSHVLLVGAFGQGNPGDEALCAAFCRALAGHDVTIVSGDPVATHRLLERPAVPSTPRSVAAAVRDADAVVVGGGTVFKQLGAASGRRPNALLANTALLLAATRARRIPLAMIGVGAGTVRGTAARSLCRWIVPRADLVVLRDEESAAVLTGAGLRPPFWIGADPAWTLIGEPRDADRSVPERRSVTVALSHHAVDRGSIDVLADTLRSLADELEIRLQPWQTGTTSRDAALAAELAERLPAARVVAAPESLDDAVQSFAGEALVIAQRFHAMVAAAAAGTRVLAIAHEPKLAGLARRLDQPAVPPHATSVVLRASIDWALTSEPAANEAVRHEIAHANHQFEMLDLLLRHGELDEPERIAQMALSSGRGAW